jgi:hypothetical protein
MNDSPDKPGEPRQRQHDFEDRHFHDDEEIVPVDDVHPRSTNPMPKRKPIRRPPPLRRHYDEED